MSDVKWSEAEGIGSATVCGVDVYVEDMRDGRTWAWGVVDGDESTEHGRAGTQAAARAAAEVYARDITPRDVVVWTQDGCGSTADVRGYRLEVWHRAGWTWSGERGRSLYASEHRCESKEVGKRRAVAWAASMPDASAPGRPAPVTADPTALDRAMRERDAAVARLDRLCGHVREALRLHGVDPTEATAADGGIALRQAAAEAYKARQALGGPGVYEVRGDGFTVDVRAADPEDAARRFAERDDLPHVRRMEVRRLGDARTFVVDVREVRDVREVDGE